MGLPASESDGSGVESVLPAEEIDATPEAAPVEAKAPETAAEVWARTMENANPITKEDVKGEKPSESAPAVERTLVAPELEKLIAPTLTKEPTELEQRLAAIEAALTPAAPAPAALDLTEEVAELKEIILTERAEKAEAVAAAEEADRYSALKEGVIANIRSAPERFPALIALDQEENVYHTLVNELKAGKSVSEDDIASQANDKLMTIYNRIHAAVTSTTEPSEEPQSSDAVDTEPTTLTPTLTGTDTPQDVDSMLDSGLDRRQAAAALWESPEITYNGY